MPQSVDTVIVWYMIPVLKDDGIYSQRVPLKEVDTPEEADLLIFNGLSYAGTVGWTAKKQFDEIYRDKLYRVCC